MTLQPGLRCQLVRLAWGIVPLAALAYTMFYYLKYGISDMTTSAIIGVVFVWIPLLIFGLYGAPSSLYWGIKNPPVIISQEGIQHCPPRGFKQVLVRWETFRGLKKYDDEYGESTALRVFSGPPEAYGLALTSTGWRVRRPRRASKKTTVSLVIPKSIPNSNNDKIRKVIRAHHQWWLRTHSNAESQKAGLALTVSDPAAQELRLAEILDALAAKIGPVELGASTIFLPQRGITFLASAAGGVFGGLVLALVGVAAIVGMLIDETSGAQILAYLLAGSFVLMGAVILMGGIKASRRVFTPPCLTITPQGLLLLPADISIPWEEYDGVRFEPNTGWTARSTVPKGDGSQPRSRTEISVTDSRYLSGEDTAQVIQGYYLAWLDAATSSPQHPYML